MALVKENFESLSDFVERAKTRPDRDDCWNDSSQRMNSDWHGGSFNQACKLAIHGWPDGLRGLSDVKDNIRASMELAPAYSMDVGGAYPIAALAAAGDPLNMVSPYEQETSKQRVIRLAVNFTITAMIDKQTVINYGAALCSWIDALENMNYRIELNAVFVATRAKLIYAGSVTIKQPQDHLDLDRVAYVYGHPTMTRRLMFAVMEQNPKAEALSIGYGKKGDWKDYKKAFPGQYILDGVRDNMTAEQAQKLVREQLEGAGLDIFDNRD